MKVHIVRPGEPTIEGYERVEIGENSVDLSRFSDNECEFILASEVYDSFAAADMEKLTRYLGSKLRMGGVLIIGGTDIRLYCKGVLNQQISEEEAANIINPKKSMTTPDRAVMAIEAAGLKVQLTQINGLHYECSCSR